MNEEVKTKLKQSIYYIIIGIVSLFSLIFLPLLGSDIELGFNYPSSFAGRVVWWTGKVIMAVLNVVIFHSFVQQGKLNIKDDPKYIEANRILGRIKLKKPYKPESPQQWTLKTYGVKAVIIFLTTAASTIALTQAIIKFDYATLLTYLFTVVMGIVFGILQMKKTELYWTTEYYDYAKILEIKENEQC